MRKLLENMKKKQEGFTLIELIIVIAILAIIAAIAVPNILGAIENSRKATDVANAKVILNAAAQMKAQDPDISQTALNNGLAAQLNGAVPEPKFQGTTFTVVVSGDTMSVVVDKTSSTNVQVAPNPHSDYNQD